MGVMRTRRVVGLKAVVPANLFLYIVVSKRPGRVGRSERSVRTRQSWCEFVGWSGDCSGRSDEMQTSKRAALVRASKALAGPTPCARTRSGEGMNLSTSIAR